TLRGVQTRAIPAGVNGRPLQTTLVTVIASYTLLFLDTKLAKGIYGDSLKKKTAISACDVFQKNFPGPAGVVGKVRPQRTIVRGGSRVTRGRRSVFPKRYTSQFYRSCVNSNNLLVGRVIGVTVVP